MIRNGAARAPVAASCIAQRPGRKRGPGWLCATWVEEKDARRAMRAPPNPSSRRDRQSRRPPHHGRGLRIHARPRATRRRPGSPPPQGPGKDPRESLSVAALLCGNVSVNVMGTPLQEAFKHPWVPSGVLSCWQSGCPDRKAGSDLIKSTCSGRFPSRLSPCHHVKGDRNGLRPSRPDLPGLRRNDRHQGPGKGGRHRHRR